MAEPAATVREAGAELAGMILPITAQVVIARTRALLNRSTALREENRAQRARARTLMAMRPGHGGDSPPRATDAKHVRTQVRQWLLAGSLPPANGAVWAGRGSGLACAVCRMAIALTDVEYEVVARNEHWLAHLDCYSVWKKESAKLLTEDGAPTRAL